MDTKIKQAKELLKKYNQEHLLYFFDNISQEEQNKLIKQILNINFEKILSLYFQTNYFLLFLNPLLHFHFLNNIF